MMFSYDVSTIIAGDVCVDFDVTNIYPRGGVQADGAVDTGIVKEVEASVLDKITLRIPTKHSLRLIEVAFVFK
jgi:hypothetical protein